MWIMGPVLATDQYLPHITSLKWSWKRNDPRQVHINNVTAVHSTPYNKQPIKGPSNSTLSNKISVLWWLLNRAQRDVTGKGSWGDMKCPSVVEGERTRSLGEWGEGGALHCAAVLSVAGKSFLLALECTCKAPDKAMRGGNDVSQVPVSAGLRATGCGQG